MKTLRSTAMTAGQTYISPVIMAFCFRSIAKYRTVGAVSSPPSLEYIIRGYVYDWSMILGFVFILFLVLRKKYLYRTAAVMSIIWGCIGIYFAYHAMFVDTSDRYLYMAIIPALGLFIAMYHIRKENSLNWKLLLFVPGTGLCVSAFIMDVIYLINYPVIHVWIIVATLIIPLDIVTYGIYHRLKYRFLK